MRNLKVRWLEYFIAVAEEESVSRATVRMNTSQAALSRVIRELEQVLNVELFQRTGRGMRLTPEGELLLNEARNVVDSYARFMASVDDVTGAGAGSLRVLLPMRLSAFVMKPFLDQFERSYANATVEVFEALNEDIQTQLRSGEVDLGIFYSPLSFSGGFGELLGSEALYVTGSPDILGDADTPITLEEAGRLPLLMQTPPASYRTFVEKCFEVEGHGLNVVRNLNTIDAHLQFARAGEGATILAYSAVHRDVSMGSLVARKIVEPEIRRDIYLGSASQAAPRLQRGAIEILKQVIAAHSEDLRWTLS